VGGGSMRVYDLRSKGGCIAWRFGEHDCISGSLGMGMKRVK